MQTDCFDKIAFFLCSVASGIEYNAMCQLTIKPGQTELIVSNYVDNMRFVRLVNTPVIEQFHLHNLSGYKMTSVLMLIVLPTSHWQSMPLKLIQTNATQMLGCSKWRRSK
jgi:hypothetical protein